MASEQMKKMIEHFRKMKEQNEFPRFDSKWLSFNALLEFRKKIERSTSNAPIEPGVSFHHQKIGDIDIEFCIPEKLLTNDIIFYIHGGGLIAGNIYTSRPFASLLAVESGLKVCSISYRLAPEHQFPAALDDCFKVYQVLIKENPNSNIALIGESGGGNLCLALTLKLKDEKVKLPCCVIVYSPVTDMTDNIKTRAKYDPFDCTVGADAFPFLRSIYCPNQDPSHPYISPLYGDYKGFPPLKIVIDSKEVLSDDGRLLAKKAKEAGVEVDFQEWEDTFHAFPPLGKGSPESYQVVKETVEFIKKHVAY